MKVALYQMDILPGDPRGNERKVKEWIEDVMQQEDVPDLLVLPEMWTTAYTLDQLEHLAEGEERYTELFLKELAREHNVNIVAGSIAKKEKGKLYNRALVFDRRGHTVYQYDKIHLVPMLSEPDYLTGGDAAASVFELEGTKMGLVICYDLRFPELMRSLALEGAEIVFIVAEWPEARAVHWEVLQRARAIENQSYVISCNRVGAYAGVTFAGRSMVIDPWGDVLIQGSRDQEQTLTTKLNPDKVSEVREAVPIFQSRVPTKYKPLHKEDVT
ncbi:carbon-nitrogen family hydrolase [Halalkalibacterium halodurans]|uniref:BH1047 protein n=1 Tax=Halalkalibacterium halodurans (strain ATCC BAA-125 / DSM 18197 / FERM 7344 / JCM 9153 / C-125) TaxID=272558 RepID=Q9KE11_HALH5|nr:carbon-nitrogen family hydrolase [Halalkalibacterium halodurans]MDY7221581.1 carbon-nitrogen family hydrolase [Halalkalibacterium halodurans]MDY7240857.1 carbon-nitrogen family hydrolase [Halalkalibacterium halodurans]MED4080512.1 carbon-nitrogen family hydrolase [Halalkalibacterium halodurans]MED4086475.1 carbon-nitrogen family hydrolase [Halalkalibacterium halodurans]MED4104816.1 carbon-nitrogen family hydrolase [Halalkalibacterium halodurans]